MLMINQSYAALQLTNTKTRRHKTLLLWLSILYLGNKHFMDPGGPKPNIKLELMKSM